MTAWPTSVSVIVPPHSARFGLGGALPVADYLGRLRAYTEAAEVAGAVGAYVYDFAVALDPWLAAFDVLDSSAALEPVVAVRPQSESPESVARRVVDLGYRFGRPTHVNLVAGAMRSARVAADDKVAARRRLAEYSTRLREEIDRRIGPADPRPSVVTPSSGTPGRVPADCVLMMARPRDALAADIAKVRAEQEVDRIAMLIGLVVRDDDEAAWAATVELFPPDRRQEVAGRLFRSDVVSSEHLRSYALSDQADVHDELLWFGAPARGIDAPKLVGSIAAAGEWLASCRDLGVTDLIIDLPPDPAEYGPLPAMLAPVPGTRP